MVKMQFKQRQLSIIWVEVCMNKYDYTEMLPEMLFLFDDGSDMNYLLIGTKKYPSEYNLIKSMYEITESQSESEMIDRKVRTLEYRIQDQNGNWMDWEHCGYGSAISDRFFDAYGDGRIVTLKELKKMIRKKYDLSK